jgi:hypothetical protein
MGRNTYFLVLVLLFSALSCGCELTREEPQLGTLYLVSIALNYHGTDVNYLYGTLPDEKDFRQAVAGICSRTERPFQGYSLIQKGGPETDEESFRPLYSYDCIDEPSLPTKDHILDQIESLSTLIKPEDLLIFYYSGHGYDNGSLVVAPSNARGAIFKDDGELDCDSLLSVDTLLDVLQHLSGTKLLILDSCYCGSFVQGDGTSVSTVENQEYLDQAFRQYWTSNSKASQVFALVATTKDNTSKEPKNSNNPHGYFTWALLEGLGWDIEGEYLWDFYPPTVHNRVLTLDSLYAFIHENQRIPTEGNSPYLYQHPLVTGGYRDLTLFRY